MNYLFILFYLFNLGSWFNIGYFEDYILCIFLQQHIQCLVVGYGYTSFFGIPVGHCPTFPGLKVIIAPPKVNMVTGQVQQGYRRHNQWLLVLSTLSYVFGCTLQMLLDFPLLKAELEKFSVQLNFGVLCTDSLLRMKEILGQKGFKYVGKPCNKKRHCERGSSCCNRAFDRWDVTELVEVQIKEHDETIRT